MRAVLRSSATFLRDLHAVHLKDFAAGGVVIREDIYQRVEGGDILGILAVMQVMDIVLEEYLGDIDLALDPALQRIFDAQCYLKQLPIVYRLAQYILGKSAVVAQYGEHKLIFKHIVFAAVHRIECHLSNY